MRFRIHHGRRAPATRVALCAAALLAVSGCQQTQASPADTTAAAATTTTEAPTLDTVSYVSQARQAQGDGKLPWFCRSQGLGGSMDHGHEDGLANNYYAGKTKGDLSPGDCDALATMFDQIIAQVKPFRTRGDLKKAGTFTQAVQFVPGLGTHDTLRSDTFKTGMGEPPRAPMFLQFDGESDDAPLAGVSWFVISGDSPPKGFPGENDWWHTHATLCYSGRGTVIANEVSDEACTKAGGTNRKLPGVWMAHAWIIPGYEDTYDVFSGAYMCLKGTGKPPAPDDPCRNDHSDPEHANTSGSTAPMQNMDHDKGSTASSASTS